MGEKEYKQFIRKIKKMTPIAWTSGTMCPLWTLYGKFKKISEVKIEKLAEIILTTIKEADYFQLAEDQTLPTIPMGLRDYDGYERCKQDMFSAGWRKVKVKREEQMSNWEVMSDEELFKASRVPWDSSHLRVAEAQAEISFKAGQKSLLTEKQLTEHDDMVYLAGINDVVEFINRVEKSEASCMSWNFRQRWQAFKKMKGIE